MDKTLKRFLSSENFVSLLLIIFLAALAYLPQVLQLGFYRDDWHVVWGGFTQGPLKIIDLHLTDRPFMGLTYALAYGILGDSPLGWHLYAFVLRVGGAISFYGILKLLWPEQRRAATLLALLFVTYPGFLQQPNANAYSNHLLGFFLGISSIALTLRAALVPSKLGTQILLGSLAALFGVGCYLMMEYMIGFEAVRLILLWYALGRGQKRNLRLRALQTFKRWLPTLSATTIFILWRVFIFKSARSVTDVRSLGKSYASQPFNMLLRVIIESAKDFIDTVLLSWFVPFYKMLDGARYGDLMISLMLVAIGIGLVVLYLRWEQSRSAADPAVDINTLSPAAPWHRDAIWIGALCALVALTPAVLANRQVQYTDAFDRYTLPGTLGGILMVGGAIFHLLRRRRPLWAVVFLLGISLITQYNNAIFFRTFWEYQRQLWWQLSWRAPDLKDNTALVVILPQSYRLWESYEIWGPANLVYSPNSDQVRIAGEVLNSTTLIPMMRQESFLRTMRRVEYPIDFKNSLVINMPTAISCVQLLDGERLEISEYSDPMVRLVASISDISLVKTSAQPLSPPAIIFGPEPARNWCYYYQRASLARQIGNWEEVARLGDQAAQAGLFPQDDVEWLPFYEGYAYLRRLDDSNRIGALLRENYSFIHTYCPQFTAAEIPPGPDEGIERYMIENICGADTSSE
jgi:hypothetical protein